jgi:hypothetical protein
MVYSLLHTYRKMRSLVPRYLPILKEGRTSISSFLVLLGLFVFLFCECYPSPFHFMLTRYRFVTDTICGGVHTFKLQDGKKSTDITSAGREEACGRTQQPQLKRLRINHYWSKSVEDFNQKLLWDVYYSPLSYPLLVLIFVPVIRIKLQQMSSCNSGKTL